MPRHFLLIERSRRSVGSGVTVVVYLLIAQRAYLQSTTRGLYPGSVTIAIHAADRRREVGILAVRMVVAFREGGGRNDGGIKVSSLAGHEGQLVAELAVAFLIQRIRGECGASVVQAHDHHPGHVSAGDGRVHAEAREVQAIEYSPLIGVDAGHFVAGPILHRDRQIGGRELLPKVRGEGIEFRSEVVGNDAGVVAGNVGRAEHVELRQGRHLIFQSDFLAIAQGAFRSREGRVLSRAWEQAIPVRNNALLAHARPECFHASRVTLMTRRSTQVGRGIQGIIRVVGRE